MGALEIVFGIIIIVLSVLLVVCVLMQSGKEKSLSGTITGGAESFFGKTKGKARDKVFSRITTVLAFVFAILAVIMYVMIAKAY